MLPLLGEMVYEIVLVIVVGMVVVQVVAKWIERLLPTAHIAKK
jgi:hypothetical protein